ncbi:MAG: RagB/SusD family nutrient uptake outer membrane protein [Bacteroides sp.]
MMKRYILFLLVSLSVFSLWSCTKDLEPPQAIVKERSLENKRDLLSWYYGFYSYFRTLQYGNFTLLQEYQADMLNATKTFGNRHYTHRWNDFHASEASVGDVYLAYYATIRNVNFFLDKVESYKPKTAGEADTVTIAKGAAHFFRAYCYHELALRWSRPYNPDELCVPWVGQLNLNAQTPRASQKEIFDHILEDLEAARRFLSKKEGVASSDEVTRDVVKALKARVALTMKDYATALEAANDLISLGKYSLLASATDVERYWHEDRPMDESIMMLYGDYAGNELTQSMYPLLARKRERGLIMQPDWLPSKWVIDLYEDSDWRKSVYFTNEQLLNVDDVPYAAKAWAVNKFPGNRIFDQDGRLNYRHLPKPFRIAEQYLIAAEAAMESGQEAVALSYLNALRGSRGLTAVTLTSDALRDAIRAERTRELAFEGFRLFDLRRWELPCRRHDPQDEEFLSVLPSESYIALDRPNNDPKFIWPIPHHDIICNPALKQNPGW